MDSEKKCTTNGHKPSNIYHHALRSRWRGERREERGERGREERGERREERGERTEDRGERREERGQQEPPDLSYKCKYARKVVMLLLQMSSLYCPLHRFPIQ